MAKILRWIRARLPTIKRLIDLDDLLIIAGTASGFVGISGQFGTNVALMVLCPWLIFLGRPKGGAK